MSNETCHNGVSGNWFFEIEQPNMDFFVEISRQPMSLQDIETRFIPDTLWGFFHGGKIRDSFLSAD